MSEEQQNRSYMSFDNLVPQTIVTASGHARTYKETLAWLKPKLSKVPITRIVDLTPLDYLGLPVWQAITPLARDLTVHSGKGMTHDAAKLSAVMEAIERNTAESLDPGREVRASYVGLKRGGKNVLDPRTCSLPYGCAYNEEATFSWVSGLDLTNKREIWVPVDLVISPPKEGIWATVETNGLASGNTYLEAIVHGLNELIERDALAHIDMIRATGEDVDMYRLEDRLVDVTDLPQVAQEWRAALMREGGSLSIMDMTSNVGIPIYQVLYFDPIFPVHEYLPTFAGFGCDVSPTRAVIRGITEAVQGHAVQTAGARDSFDNLVGSPRTSFYMHHAHCTFGKGNRKLRPEPDVSDLYDILNHTLQLLNNAGYEQVISVDVTRASLQVPVVRMIVPGLTHPIWESGQALTPTLISNVRI